MMAADNDDAYNLSPAFILETVAAAKLFIAKEKYKNLGNVTEEWGLAPKIASFLAWPSERVKRALSQFSTSLFS